MMPPFVVFPTNRIAHFVEVSLYLFYLAQQVKLHIRVISLSHFDILISPIYIICGIVYGVNQFFYTKFEKISVFSEREIRKIQIQKYCLLYLIIKGNG